MTSLSCAAPPPPPGEVTRYEAQCAWITSPEDELDSEQVTTTGLADLMIKLNDSPLFEHSSDAMFLPTESENIAKKSLNAWYYSGFLSGLETLAEHQVDGNVPWPSRCSLLLLGALRSVSALHSSFYPHLLLSGEQLLEKFSTGSHWSTNPIRAMQWHPHAPRLAVAGKDNLVQVYQLQTSATASCASFQSGRMQQLKHPEQRRISSVAWRPYSGSCLAVGCQTGVMLWQVRSHPGAPRPQPQHLSSSGHSPVTSVAWSSDGRLLASGSPADASFMLWDVSRADCPVTPIRRHGGGGVSLLAWSPAVPGAGTSRLLTGTPSPMFRVWETTGFTCERWSNLSGRVVAACWSPKSDVLLFALEADSSIYSLTFFAGSQHSVDSTKHVGGADTAVRCVDLTAVDMPSSQHEDDIISVGGCVQSMCWDVTGERLAVTFTADSPGHSLVAMFSTRTQPVVEVVPSGFIRGRTNDLPVLVAFQNDLRSGGQISVAWSSGRISFIPLLFSVPGSTGTPSRAKAAAVASVDGTFSAHQRSSMTPSRHDLTQHHLLTGGGGGAGGAGGNVLQSPLLLSRPLASQ